MAVPHPAEITLPLLRYLGDGSRRSRVEWTSAVARALRLTGDDLAVKKARGGALFDNYCSWAWIHLQHARLVDGKAAGPTWITRRGEQLLAEDPSRVDGSTLNRYSEYRSWTKHWADVPLHLRPTADPKMLDERVKEILKQGAPTNPAGVVKPRRISITSDQFERDPAVKARVLELATGKCESCGSDAPFVRPDGERFLEVHHVVPLAKGGPDVVTNTVAVCPNCHRALHLARDARGLARALYEKVSRLQA